MLQKRAVHEIDFVRAPAECLVGKRPDIFAQHESRKLHTKIVCQNAAFAQELKNYKFINVMDDSGLENLKKVKLSYHPVKLVPAYIVRRKHE